MKTFALRLAQNSIPIEVVRHRRNMADSNVWEICNNAEVSWRHALVDCDMSKCVWALLDEELVEHIIACGHADARLWLMELMESTREEEFFQILIALWAIWSAHRKEIHEYIFHSPLTMFNFIQKFLGDQFLIPRRVAVFASSSAAVQRQRRVWRAPTQGCMKLNVDAAVSRNQDKGSCAVICRDGQGSFVGASVLVTRDLVQPESLEALAFSEALNLASALYLSKIQIATDCAATIAHLTSEYMGPNRAIFQDIKMMMEEFAQVHFEHEKREHIWEVHDLAKASVTLYLWGAMCG